MRIATAFHEETHDVQSSAIRWQARAGRLFVATNSAHALKPRLYSSESKKAGKNILHEGQRRFSIPEPSGCQDMVITSSGHRQVANLGELVCPIVCFKFICSR